MCCFVDYTAYPPTEDAVLPGSQSRKVTPIPTALGIQSHAFQMQDYSTVVRAAE